VRQQYHFSPSRASKEIQVYRVELEDLVPFEATIVPNKSGGDAYASLAELLLAGNGELVELTVRSRDWILSPRGHKNHG
jgi:hypothetical protein